MSSLYALVKLNFRAMLNMFGGTRRNKTKGSGSGIGILVLLIVLALYISGVYSYTMAKMFAPEGMLAQLPAIMAVMTVAFSLVLTAFGAGGIIFGGKDMDLMLSLPISSFSVMLSKVLALYLENAVICIFMMIPCGAAYFYFGGDGGIYFIVAMVVLTLFLAIIPTLFGILIGLILTWMQSRLGGNPLFANLCYVVLFVGVMILSFRLNMALANSMLSVESIGHLFDTALYPIGLFGKGILGNIGAALLFMVVTTASFVIIVYLFSKKYKALLSKLSSHANRSDYKMKSLKSTGPFGALLKKELGRFWGTPIYLFNTGIGVIMAIGGSVYACIQRDNIEVILGQFGSVNTILVLSGLIAFLFILTNPASVSISLEGKTLWILKEAPLSVKAVLGAKAALNMILILGTAVICLPMVWFAFALSATELFCLSLLCVSLALFVPSFGLWVNLKFPKMDGSNDALIVKQSKASFISIFGGAAIMGAGVSLYRIGSKMVSDLNYLLICSAVLGIAGIVMFVLLFRKGQDYLLRL